MVECMSVVVNVMLSLRSVMSPPPVLCNLSLRTVVKLCILDDDDVICAPSYWSHVKSLLQYG